MDTPLFSHFPILTVFTGIISGFFGCFLVFFNWGILQLSCVEIFSPPPENSEFSPLLIIIAFISAFFNLYFSRRPRFSFSFSFLCIINQRIRHRSMSVWVPFFNSLSSRPPHHPHSKFVLLDLTTGSARDPSEFLEEFETRWRRPSFCEFPFAILLCFFTTTVYETDKQRLDPSNFLHDLPKILVNLKRCAWFQDIWHFRSQ